MDDVDLPRLVHDVYDRLLIVEHKLGLPMSFVDRMLAEEMLRRRQARLEADARRDAAFRKAKTEAESLGHNGPVDDFVRELRRGAFE
jgi:hypothetical protein